MAALTGFATYATVGDSNEESEVLLDISNSSNIEVLALIFLIDLNCLASTTYHHLNTSSLPLLYSTEGIWTVNGFLKVISVTRQHTMY